VVGLPILLIAAAAGYFHWSRTSKGPDPPSGRLLQADHPECRSNRRLCSASQAEESLSLIIVTDNGAILYFSRQYNRAMQWQAVLELEPNFPRAHLQIFAYAQQGRYQEALADIEQWRKVQDGPWIWAAQAYVYGRSGQRACAQRALDRLKRFSGHQAIDPSALLLSHSGMGTRTLPLKPWKRPTRSTQTS
jgi:tetratricopeptide (TPR) repeat protein